MKNNPKFKDVGRMTCVTFCFFQAQVKKNTDGSFLEEEGRRVNGVDNDSTSVCHHDFTQSREIIRRRFCFCHIPTRRGRCLVRRMMEQDSRSGRRVPGGDARYRVADLNHMYVCTVLVEEKRYCYLVGKVLPRQGAAGEE